VSAEGRDVVGIGESSVDFVYRVAGPVAPGAKQPIVAHRVAYGGQVATTLAACAAFGLRTAYVGAFGQDEHGARLRDALVARGIDVSHARTRPATSRYAVIAVDDRTGERTVFWSRDPALRLGAADVPADAVARARLLHVDDTDPDAALAAIAVAREAGIPITCDLDDVTDAASAVLAGVTVPILAEHVPEGLTGEADPERALRALRRRGHHDRLCVTLGARGALLLDGDRLHTAAAPVVGVVDTTAAGDVFRGAFIHGLLRGDTPDAILRLAVTAAALACTREGALDAVPSADDVRARLAR
jgi:sugar/nucleoside kinase (ribokinase family)